ncbi:MULTISPECIES: poly(3-hydroxyalkanoate) depolymerase [unclassified Burkholderia]|uniref:poly(3-hydroxyalkanoate) depolymerase n=1 Tax=unclassified Burkholderia TaxID=2613784 RepID=UPI002AB12C0A|nr:MULTISPECIES: poly(3-hydroxyalkanoate) depolymerase [unclassified Burkholderia]
MSDRHSSGTESPDEACRIGEAEVRTLEVDGQSLKVVIRTGSLDGAPLLIFNGIGANLELLEPFTTELTGIETIAFDVPGVGGSPAPTLPYRFWGLARLINRMMLQLGYDGQIDVMGISWGGALAQQFAFQFPGRCRRLVLAATSPGVLMVPGKLSVLSKMVNPRRYSDARFLERVGADLYGGAFRDHPERLREHGRHLRPPRGRGYLYQLLAAWGWSSLPWLPMLSQPTLVIAGNDDPIIPMVNAKVLATMIRKAKLNVVDDGHLFIVNRPQEIASMVRQFLSDEGAPSPSLSVHQENEQ